MSTIPMYRRMNNEQLGYRTTSVRSIKRFRILVIGNANAGKTTILDNFCHAQGRKPFVVGERGASDLKPSDQCGAHTIETEFVYSTAAGFVFHDSRGFEAGGVEESKKAIDFICERANAQRLEDQLHAIWYCIPTNKDRPLMDLEIAFLKQIENVPIIAIFTKLDALEELAFSELFNEGISKRDAKKRAAGLAEERFQDAFWTKFADAAPQSKVVRLRDMHKQTHDYLLMQARQCDELLKQTVLALDEEVLGHLHVCMRRNQLTTNIQDVIRQVVIPEMQGSRRVLSLDEQKLLLQNVMTYFPHVTMDISKDAKWLASNATRAAQAFTDSEDLLLLHEERLMMRDMLPSHDVSFPSHISRIGYVSTCILQVDDVDKLVPSCFKALSSNVSQLVDGFSFPLQVLRIATLCILTLDRSFSLIDWKKGHSFDDRVFGVALHSCSGSAKWKTLMAGLDVVVKESNGATKVDAERLLDLILANRI